MATQTAIFPRPGKVNVQMWTGDGSRIRLVRLDDDTTIHVPCRPVLDALQAALDEIRADMDAEPAAVAS